MSSAWYFYRYSRKGFQKVFGHSGAEDVDCFTDWLSSEMSGLDAHPETAALIRNMLTRGLSYAGLSEPLAKILDTLVKSAFSPEGFPVELQLCPLSPQGLDLSVVSELLTHASSTPVVLPLFLSGRRFEAKSGCPCGYCMLAPDEGALLLDEVQHAFSAAPTWSDPHVPEFVQEYFISPLLHVNRKREHLYVSLD
jgi:hypothetical protein